MCGPEGGVRLKIRRHLESKFDLFGLEPTTEYFVSESYSISAQVLDLITKFLQPGNKICQPHRRHPIETGVSPINIDINFICWCI